MSARYSEHVNPRGKNAKTPQTQPIPGREEEMKKNNAGGFSFKLTIWDTLDRFLVLGTEGGSYYASERKMTQDSAKNIQKCIDEDGLRVVQRVVEISDSGRAPKNDPALFVLAMCAASGEPAVRTAAIDSLPKVARIGTHLFHFAEYVQAFRGWGRGLKRGVANWYNEQSVDNLAYQVVKYKSRDGWSNRDLLRLSHPKTSDESRNTLYKWIVKPDSVNLESIDSGPMVKIKVAEQLARETDAKVAAKLIREYRMPREVVNTELLNNTKVWDALLEDMPMTAMVRNLGKMSSIGCLKPLSDNAVRVVETLTSEEKIRKSRLHPLSILAALKIYERGYGEKGSLSWTPNKNIVNALDSAFYLAFHNVVPTGKKILIALDVSGSMTLGDIAGMPGITPRVGSAAMALITMAREKNTHVVGFCDTLQDLDISPKMTLGQVMKKIERLPFGGTDCALPMVHAKKKGLDVDGFFVYTDSETWAGSIQPVQALRDYRRSSGNAAKLVVVGMTATQFTIADPKDAGMMDVVGFDSAAPQIMADFLREGR